MNGLSIAKIPRYCLNVEKVFKKQSFQYLQMVVVVWLSVSQYAREMHYRPSLSAASIDLRFCYFRFKKKISSCIVSEVEAKCDTLLVLRFAQCFVFN